MSLFFLRSLLRIGFYGLAIIPLLVPNTAAQADAVDDYLKTRMAREHIPGLSLLVIREGKVIKAKGYGTASIEMKVPATPETVYDLASTTKPFVATAGLLLMQDGKLTLDDKINRFLPDAPDSWKGITVRHLLSHTSGIKDYLGNDPHKDFPHDAPAEDILKWATALPLNFAPGAKWEYSNTGFVLLAMIVEKVSGKSYDAFLQERVFTPYGMKNTHRDFADSVIPHRAAGYLWYGGAYHNADFLKYMTTGHGPRGIVSNVLDLAKWDAALSGDSLLTAATKKTMWTPVIKFNSGYNDDFEYALGWFLRKFNGHRQFSHPGGAPGTATMFSRYPDDNLTVILLTNGGKAFPQALELGVARHYIPDLFPVKTVTLPTAALESCTGYYNAFGSQILNVFRDKSGLYADDGGGINNEFLPISETKFVAAEADRAFTVARNKSGEVTDASFFFGNGKSPVQRIGPLASVVKPKIDPEPALTRKIEAVLKAFDQGGKVVEEVPQLAPKARKDYSNGPSPELAGIQSISYLTAQDIRTQNIERHGATATRVLYYKLRTDRGARFVLVWLTADNLVTDQDVVER